ncbi:MAG: hypothetical protein ACR2GG_11585 [Gemmatimonadaceae bacterium]
MTSVLKPEITPRITAIGGSIESRVAAADWPHVAIHLDAHGFAMLKGILASIAGTISRQDAHDSFAAGEPVAATA